MKLVEQMREDLRATLERNATERGALEAVLVSSGVGAVLLHRVAHRLWRRDLFVLARGVAALARWWTGADVHPAAQIGRRFVMDRAAGVVIGATAEVGDDVLMFPGTVLGGVGATRHKRHPTVGHRTVIGPGAVLLGRLCVGADAKIGAGSVVIADVPEGAVAVGVPARVVERDRRCAELDLAHGELPDPVGAELAALRAELAELRARIERDADGTP